MTDNPLPPHSVEAEKSILGGCLIDEKAAHKVDLQDDDFYVDSHRRLWRVIRTLAAHGITPDLVTMSEKLKQAGDLDNVGGLTYMAELIDFTPTAANISYYVNIVRRKSTQRKTISAAREIQRLAYNIEDPDALLSESFGQLQAIDSASGAEKVWLSAAEQAEEYKKSIMGKEKDRFYTGFPDLDVLINGVAPGEVMMIVGYSGTFKSAFLQNVLINSAVKTKKNSLFYSMEMPANLVYQRTVQIGLEQSTYFIESGYAGKKPGYEESTMQELDKLGIAEKLKVCQTPALTTEQVEHYARLAKAQFGEVGVVGIDYLGLMSAKDARSEYERISYCAEQSKNMAKRLNMPVVILTQINRQSARDGEMEMHSAKGSGAVEASADYMIGIQRNKQKEIIIKLMKNRSGEANLQFKADLDAKFLKFRSLEPYNEIAQKNVQRGRDRKAHNIREAAYDGYDPFQ